MARLKRISVWGCVLSWVKGVFPAKLRQLKAQRMQLKSLKSKLKVFFRQKVNNAKLTFRLSTGSEKCIFFGYFVCFSFFCTFIFFIGKLHLEEGKPSRSQAENPRIENDSCSYSVRRQSLKSTKAIVESLKMTDST